MNKDKVSASFKSFNLPSSRTVSHHTPIAAATFKVDIRADSGDRPLVGAARMRFAQADDVIEFQFGEHEALIPRELRHCSTASEEAL